jgi:hypothetical protein
VKSNRSSSQVLYSMLPLQTTDIQARIWRVDQWLGAIPLAVDAPSLRRRILASMDPWIKSDNDGGVGARLLSGAPVQAVGINKSQGVSVSLWPNNWVCSKCRRLRKSPIAACACGSTQWSQFHFVSFHECGFSGEPWIAPCQTHNEVMVNSPRSSNAKDLRFTCPVCHAELLKGLGAGRPCPGCNQPGLNFNVHRAATVYTAHGFTMVNPARPEQLQSLLSNGGAEKCLEWILSGMPGDRPSDLEQTAAQLTADLEAKGMSQSIASAAVAAMKASGHTFANEAGGQIALSSSDRESLFEASVDVALAVFEGRRSTIKLPNDDLAPELQDLYENAYPRAVVRAGLREVDFVDRFPILRGNYGFSRGGGTAGETRLVMFAGNGGAITVHADASETEALFLRLDPVRVAAWLVELGFLATSSSDRREAQTQVLEVSSFPERGDDDSLTSAGAAVLTLIHSYSHRIIRQLAILAGVDRESLAEYVVPGHLGVFVYGTPRGDFVLGGLQSVFETDFDRLLDRQVDAEHRCPLDPGCERASGACVACLHLGEPSCSYYNRFLSRDVLFGPSGFLAAG